MLILGIETTCDETGAAVVKDGRYVLSNVVASSVDLQKKYGGVVPEVAAREQVRSILPVIAEALGKASGITNNQITNSKQFQNSKLTKWVKENIDAIAVAHGPGLIGSLLIGVETAKVLALAWGKPLIPVNHLVGHIYSNWLEPTVNGKSLMANGGSQKTINDKQYTLNFPFVALIVSGGHTDLVLMTDHGKYKLLGSTLDDAAGEAFDKVARVLGLGYPGGPQIERVAGSWSQVTSNQKPVTHYQLPRPMINSKDFDFSFSGLKTAVVNSVHSIEIADHRKAEIAAEFQNAIVDVLLKKTMAAAQRFNARSIVVGGGVAANSELRSRMSDVGKKEAIKIIFPSKELSIDNGAMIAAAAFYNFKKVDPLKLSVDPSLHFSRLK